MIPPAIEAALVAYRDDRVLPENLVLCAILRESFFSLISWQAHSVDCLPGDVAWDAFRWCVSNLEPESYGSHEAVARWTGADTEGPF